MSKLPGSTIPLFKMKVEETGTIRDIKEIVVRIDGLPSCLKGQILDMGDGVKSMVMGFDQDDVHALVLGDPGKLRMGKEIRGVSEPFTYPVTDDLIGRMVGALGEPLDAGGELVAETYLPVFRDSPPITARAPISESMPTGNKIIDMLTPLAKGQRQLILGDRMTGKTSIGLDAIINQKGRDVVCIYCGIGKSVSNLEKALSALRGANALEYTCIVVATDASPVGEQYIVPYAAATISDYFAGKGKDVLVVIDDLTKHAWAYRQLSLLLEMPPGREAYPGDIFYVQTMLMERAGKFNEANGDGSITFLGIAETLQGDLTGYIPSNLASMCDGQVVMSNAIFAEGFRPAIDATLSLSIVGGKGQPKILRNLSKKLRSDYAKYNEVVKLSKLQSGLSGEAERIVNKGESIRAIFQQGERMPVGLAEEVLLLYGVEKEYLMTAADAVRKQFCREIYSFACEQNQSLVNEIEDKQEMTPEMDSALDEVMKQFFAHIASLESEEEVQPEGAEEGGEEGGEEEA